MYVKISLEDTEALHLRKIEVFIDRKIYNLPFPNNVAISMLSTAPPTPPPENLCKEYTLDGKISMRDWYFNDTNNSINPPHITKSAYSIFFILIMIYSIIMVMKVKYFFEVINKYPFFGKNVTIWGLAGINLDAFSLWVCVNNVYVVEYNKPIIEHEKVSVFNTSEFQSRIYNQILLFPIPVLNTMV